MNAPASAAGTSAEHSASAGTDVAISIVGNAEAADTQVKDKKGTTKKKGPAWPPTGPKPK